MGKHWTIKDTSKMRHSAWNSGKVGVYSEETKQKMSLVKKGKPAAWIGTEKDAEIRKKISVAKAGKVSKWRNPEERARRSAEAHTGNKSHFWKDGRTSLPGYTTFMSLKRRAREVEAEGSHTFGEWEWLKAQYNWTCPSCHRKEPEIFLTEDHIIPLIKGGSNNLENIQPLCLSCNCKKHTKIIKYDFVKVDTQPQQPMPVTAGQPQ